MQSGSWLELLEATTEAPSGVQFFLWVYSAHHLGVYAASQQQQAER